MNISTLIILAVLAGAAAVAWGPGPRRVGAPVALVAWLTAPPPRRVQYQAQRCAAFVVVAALAAVLVWHRWSRTSATVTRWSARSRRKAGVASTLDVVRHASAAAMRRRAGTVRPSLAGQSRPRRWVLPVAEVSVQLCRTGLVQVHALIEDVVVAFGGPRAGKSGWLAGRVIDAPGAVVVTSTRTDLYDLTKQLRAERGPVFVFNAVGLAGLRSTITFDPLTGCANPVTAVDRATDMIAAASRASGGDREFWDAQARRVLAALLHAAALGGESMQTVQRWVADPASAEREVLVLLRRSAEPAFSQDAAQFTSTNDRTRSSITSSIMPALGWLTSPAAAAAGAAGRRPFDVEGLLRSRATVYLLGGEESQAAPLVSALTGHIAREARRLAATCPGGRLDPPLRLCLDEAALICPVPLDQWTADMGGRGVTIVCCFQSRAQLLARYGEHAAATILNNTGAVMLFGGTRDRDDLQFWSTLAGERDEPITTTDLHGRVASRTVRKVAVLPPAAIANLPAGKVVVIRRGIAPVIGRATMAWRRRDVRRLTTRAARAENAARRARRLADLRLRRDEAAEYLVARLARRWPDRFAGTAERMRTANTMFRELRRIQSGDLDPNLDMAARPALGAGTAPDPDDPGGPDGGHGGHGGHGEERTR